MMQHVIAKLALFELNVSFIRKPKFSMVSVSV